ncbi:MAG: transposase, partial [Acidimicrobiia bacterium]|nr:transposase [Acidimicrobiia bacterium]
MSRAVIGVDPAKRVNAVAVVNAKGSVLARAQFANDGAGFRELRTFARRWRSRVWAVEGCNGTGKHLAQRLVAGRETVLDVSTRRAALVRVFAGGNGRKTDETDAESIALVGLRTPDLVEVRPDDRTVSLRLLSNRRCELVSLRTQAVCRIHRDLAVLSARRGPQGHDGEEGEGGAGQDAAPRGGGTAPSPADRRAGRRSVGHRPSTEGREPPDPRPGGVDTDRSDTALRRR